MSLFNISFVELLQHLVNGVTIGFIYALIALGYTMVYGILKLINFAHGEFLMLGTYVSLIIWNYFISSYGNNFLLFLIALIVGVLFSALVGVVTEKLAYKPLRKANRLAPLLSAIGVSIILSNLAAMIFGTKAKKFEYPYINEPISIFHISITPHQIVVIVVSIFLMVVLRLFVGKTKWGKAMRAASEDLDTASLMGININSVISLTFAIGAGLATIAGVFMGMEFKVYPTMGTMAGLKAFIAAVFGGIGNISGAMLGGVILGILETFGVAILGISQGLKDTISFSILILILIFKPSGLLGKKVKEKV
ncbi:MAG: branched-chain amino acid ABC transporter permease [Brevinematales bacterium]|nr:branched-chain amino acid ABC transporter permease [Brevinematales bacterium]